MELLFFSTLRLMPNRETCFHIFFTPYEMKYIDTRSCWHLKGISVNLLQTFKKAAVNEILTS